MIESIKEVRDLVIPVIQEIGLTIDRTKQTTSDQSIYIYTNEGVVRISDHHNQNSFDKCIVSITVPVKKEVAIKMIRLLRRQ
ncbi:hypothetical protein [Roseivirga spongicola]|uniref:Uncharacterized protein n=1 Tax=Roseivirga spongicola TaxID=333140 RepID=A0A150XCE7_9BACT|nr:hypothetical protein [Roseivirga spongicola]KYG76409.1 hypothetical protein AWW68_19375 [Roseivirga spongicola]WPZ08727.1 hypothetical protein T7867_10705 [Roseivirga spongicola]